MRLLYPISARYRNRIKSNISRISGFSLQNVKRGKIIQAIAYKKKGTHLSFAVCSLFLLSERPTICSFWF